MTELYLVRHADAGDPTRWAGDDASRPLSGKGRRQAARLARLLREAACFPDAILSSPKVRAADTAAVLAAELGGAVHLEPTLEGGFGIEELERLLEGLGRRARVMLVGHDPDFSELASALVDARISMRKGALARIDLDGPATAGGGLLRWLVPPDAIAER